MSIELVLKIFINAMVTGCSSERSSVTFAGQESRPYSNTGIHLDVINAHILQAKHYDQDDRKWR